MKFDAAPWLVVPLALLSGCYEGPNHSRRQDGGLEAGSEAGAPTDGDEDDADADAAGDAEPPLGAQCGVNGRDDCGPFLVCNHALGCVECASDEDCPVADGHCMQGTCVGCRPSKTTDCPDQACWSSDFECHARCGGDADCPEGMTCDHSSGACVGCVASSDCPAGACSSTKKLCVECTVDADCSKRAPRCHVATGACVKCRSNDDCGLAAPICDPKAFECRVGCMSNAQCPGRTCDVSTATCVDPADGGAVDAGSADAG